jgi:hypothetical protein
MNHTINICLIPSWDMFDTCKELNSLDTGLYNINSRDYIPHITLGMKTLSWEQIQSLYEEIQKLKLQKQTSSTLWYYGREVAPWDLWTGITIEKTTWLHQVQKAVLEVSEKYESQERNKNTYAIDEFYEEKEINFFKESEYLERDSFHITLWKQDIREEYNKREIPEQVRFEKLIIWKIWNYGSLREILFEIPLK